MAGVSLADRQENRHIETVFYTVFSIQDFCLSLKSVFVSFSLGRCVDKGLRLILWFARRA